MKRLTASDAARRFSAVLDEVENNRETFVVVRNGKVVAQLGPAAAASGRAVKDLLRTSPPDKAWAGRACPRAVTARAGGAAPDRLILNTTVLISAERAGPPWMPPFPPAA